MNTPVNYGEIKMIRVSLSFFYGLGATLRPMSALNADMPILDAWSEIYKAQNELSSLLGAEWLLPALKSAYAPGQKLLTALKKVTDRKDFKDPLSFMEIYEIKNALTEFDTVLRAELQISDSYFVTRKAGYDTYTLITTAEQIFASELPIKIPSAVRDIRECGKCLAFELSTAAGFHILRVTEAVVRNYWEAVSKGQPHPRTKTLGNYANKMDKADIGKKKVIETIRQIAELHRNPLMHPEESLTMEEAVCLFGICNSAITSMLKEIPLPEPLAVSSATVA